MKKILAGSFDCEKFWSEGEAQLPKIRDTQADNCILVMDELLSVLGNPGDALLTRFRISREQIDYFNDIGIGVSQYISLEKASEKRDILWDISKDVFSLACMDNYEIEIEPACVLMPFSILENTRRMASKYALGSRFPDYEIVRKVNGKLFSTKLNRELGLFGKGCIVVSLEELVKKGDELLAAGPFLIKENYGVSGKGNMIVESQGRFESIIKYLKKQEEMGEKIEFVLEPLIKDKLDFSTQFEIERDGSIRFSSVQVLYNDGFSYKGSVEASRDLIKYLLSYGYFGSLERVGKCLYEQGYFGPVCIDSMVVDKKEVYEVVEINARMSMSYIKHSLDNEFGDELEHYFTYYNLKIPSSFQYADLLGRMQQEGILYRKKKGILPLTSGMMVVNKKSGSSFYRGRLYFMDIGGGNQQNRLKGILEEEGMKIL